MNAQEMTKQEFIEKTKNEILSLRNLAKANVGKYISKTSLGHVKVEKGHGLNNTDYSFAFQHAVIFDTMKEAYDACDFYLKSKANGKTIDVYVSPAKADEFFNNEADILEKSLKTLEEK